MIVIRIKVDENLPIEVARKFNAAGHDALSVLDQKMGGASDKAYVLNMVERVVEALGGEEINGRLWIVDESRVRIRE